MITQQKTLSTPYTIRSHIKPRLTKRFSKVEQLWIVPHKSTGNFTTFRPILSHFRRKFHRRMRNYPALAYRPGRYSRPSRIHFSVRREKVMWQNQYVPNQSARMKINEVMLLEPWSALQEDALALKVVRKPQFPLSLQNDSNT